MISIPGTPLPWINYLGSEDFPGMISNTLGGYWFYRDAKPEETYFLNGVIKRPESKPGGSLGRHCYGISV